MNVSEVMTRDVKVATPDQSIREAAHLMAEIDAGTIPVGENDRLVGMLTDHDIAVRAVAQGRGPDTPVREIMSASTVSTISPSRKSRATWRRLPVLDRDERLVGILSIGDIAVRSNAEKAGEALRGVARPGGEHSQSGERSNR